MTKRTPKKHEEEILTIRIPRDAWDVLFETLALDARSIGCDKALRRVIQQALKQVHENLDQLTAQAKRSRTSRSMPGTLCAGRALRRASIQGGCVLG